ncbi:MAG: hypothetical protein DMF78_19965 [Acidobacteria bacterium]|nr:MAG: hypothetical protein DMF78_19965 [Acidobacteriota bacterium]
MTRRALVSLLVLCAAAGCAVGPRYKRPSIPVPVAWTEGAGVPGSGPALGAWWTSFHDPVLERLVARAVEGTLDLKIAAARIREARAAAGIAAAAGLPQVTAEASYARTRRSDAVPPFKSASGDGSPFGKRDQNLFQAGFDAAWEIDVFGGVRRDREAALADAQAAEEGRRDVLVTLLADVARTYTELRGVQQEVRILEDTLRSERDTVAITRARFQAGLGAELDVARAEGLLAASTAQRPELERQARQAIYRLGVLIGAHPGSLVSELDSPAPIPVGPPDVPPTLPSELLSRRPDLRRAERALAAATARVGVARADLFPRFVIAGSLGRRSEDAGDLGSGVSQFWSLVPIVRWPLVSGGRVRANIRVQDARQEQALRQYEKTILIALEEVENALSSLARERRREESLRDSVAANQRALDLAMERYSGGLEGFLSVLDAQRSVYAAEDQLVQAERSAVVSLVAVYKSLGGGWSPGAPDPSAGQIEGGRP